MKKGMTKPKKVMKLFVWADPYQVSYGSSTLYAVAETVEDARRIAAKAPRYSFGKFCQDSTGMEWVNLGDPDRILDLPCAEWNEVCE